jgi:large subunit ribosomal protein L25
MKEIRLNAETRHGVGKGNARKIRRTGMVPGILYGPETKPLNLALKANELAGLIRHEGRTNMLIDLGLANDKAPRKVIIRELQRDPVTGTLKHVDFYQVSMKKKIHISVRVNLVGIASGVKNAGGILEHVTREIEIACLPTNIPERIEVDVSKLEIGDSVHVRDLKIENVDVITDINQTIATVVPPTVIKTEAAPAAAAEAVEGPEAAPAEGEGKPEGEAAKKPEEAAKEAKPAKEGKEKK